MNVDDDAARQMPPPPPKLNHGPLADIDNEVKHLEKAFESDLKLSINNLKKDLAEWTKVTETIEKLKAHQQASTLPSSLKINRLKFKKEHKEAEDEIHSQRTQDALKVIPLMIALREKDLEIVKEQLRKAPQALYDCIFEKVEKQLAQFPVPLQESDSRMLANKTATAMLNSFNKQSLTINSKLVSQREAKREKAQQHEKDKSDEEAKVFEASKDTIIEIVDLAIAKKGQKLFRPSPSKDGVNKQTQATQKKQTQATQAKQKNSSSSSKKSKGEKKQQQQNKQQKQPNSSKKTSSKKSTKKIKQNQKGKGKGKGNRPQNS